MKQQCSPTDEQIEAIALDSLEFFGQPESELAPEPGTGTGLRPDRAGCCIQARDTAAPELNVAQKVEPVRGKQYHF